MSPATTKAEALNIHRLAVKFQAVPSDLSGVNVGKEGGFVSVNEGLGGGRAEIAVWWCFVFSLEITAALDAVEEQALSASLLIHQAGAGCRDAGPNLMNRGPMWLH